MAWRVGWIHHTFNLVLSHLPEIKMQKICKIIIIFFHNVDILILQDVFEMRYAKIPDDGPGGGLDLGDSDLDSEDEREKKLLQLQEQLRQMQEQMRILVEESMRSKKRKNKFAPATPGKFNDRYNINGII